MPPPKKRLLGRQADSQQQPEDEVMSQRTKRKHKATKNCVSSKNTYHDKGEILREKK